jgi:hypothetical protein
MAGGLSYRSGELLSISLPNADVSRLMEPPRPPLLYPLCNLINVSVISDILQETLCMGAVAGACSQRILRQRLLTCANAGAV